MNALLEHPEVKGSETSSPSGVEPALPTNIRREVTESHICILTFDRPKSSANIFDAATLRELNEHLDFLESERGLHGVVFNSAKNSIFIAGADLQAIAKMAGESRANLASFIELGQNTFNRVAKLPMPTIAAIHGACVGGGYELCLACDYRIASEERSTKIGLPEVQLGILPAWGGSTPLPRLIGISKALDIILAGKTLASKPALKSGLIDQLVPRELLLEKAIEKAAVLRIKPVHTLSFQQSLMTNAVAGSFIRPLAKSKLWKKTRGHYSAPAKALEVITRGISKSVDDSLQLEADAILELANSAVSHNLVQVFFLQERAKKLTYPGPSLEKLTPSPAKHAAVIGAGVMGAGIAQWLSARGLTVLLRDVSADAIGKGMGTISQLYAEGTKRKVFTRVEARAGMDRISPSATEVPLANMDVIIEAAVERMDLKKQIFARLDELAGEKTILATNTSALSVTELAESTKHPERVVGIHFFNPVQKMQLVEVVVGKQTSVETAQRSVKFAQQIGKLPVVVKDSPGFLVNRILMPYLMEAVRLFEHGANVEELDEVMLDFGMPMGPLRLIDEVGVDVSQHVAVTLAAAFRDRLHLPPVLEKMLQGKLLGKKSASGFYVYSGKNPEINSALGLFQTNDSAANLSRERLQEQMVFLMVNEAARCLEEQIVESPADVDFGMIMGTGFAPFRGGPLRHADSIGAGKMVLEMKRLVDLGEPHFEPCQLLQHLATEGRTFY